MKKLISLSLLLIFTLVGCNKNEENFELIKEATTLLDRSFVLQTDARKGEKSLLPNGAMPVLYRFSKKSDTEVTLRLENFRASDRMPFMVTLNIDMKLIASKQHNGWIEFSGEKGTIHSGNSADKLEYLNNDLEIRGEINPITREINFKIDTKMGITVVVNDVLEGGKPQQKASPREATTLLNRNFVLKSNVHRNGEAILDKPDVPALYQFKKISADLVAMTLNNFSPGNSFPYVISLKANLKVTEIKEKKGWLAFEGDDGEILVSSQGKKAKRYNNMLKISGEINPATKEINFIMKEGGKSGITVSVNDLLDEKRDHKKEMAAYLK